MRALTAYQTQSPRILRIASIALLGAAVAACFAAGNTHAATVQSMGPGWQIAQLQPQDGAQDWSGGANAGGGEQPSMSSPAADEGSPDWAAPAEQGGPGWNAPDAGVDDSTDVQSPDTAPARAATPDRAALALNILFPPYSADLSGDASEALSSVAKGMGDVPGTVLIIARADPVEQGHAAELSLARAQGVAEYLALAGVDPQRIVLRAVGDTQPLVDPDVCGSVTGADLAACLAPDRSVTVAVFQH